MAITGAAKLRHRILKKRNNPVNEVNKKLVGELVQVVTLYLTKRMDTVSGRTLANTLRALADVSTSGDALVKLLESAAEQMRDRPHDFNGQERCMLVGTLASQRIFPGNVINESINRVRMLSYLALRCLGQTPEW